MKKNPLFISKTNANKSKIRHAKKGLILSLLCVFSVVFITTISFANPTSGKSLAKCAGTSAASLAFLPLAAGVKGKLSVNGVDETEADFDARKGKGETDEQFVKRYLSFLESEIKKGKDMPEFAIELKTLKETVSKMAVDADLVKNLKVEVERANLAIEALKEKEKKEQHISFKSQLTEWAEKNKQALINIKSGTKTELSELVIKVNSPMTPSNTYSGSSFLPIPEFAPGATEIVRVQPTFWDYITKGRSSSATYVWVNRKTPSGAADFIGPGVAKPGVSFVLATETSVAKKVAVSDKCATELLDDIDGMASYIQQELAYQLRAKVNTILMSGTSSSTVPAGIQTISTTFTLTTVQTTNPTEWDAIVACVAQLRSGNLMGPVTAFMNPVDYANMKLRKAASQGQLFIPQESGATIVEDNNIPVGYLQIAILPYYKVLIYKDFQVTFGWENDDFTKNLVTTIGEMRIHQFFSENYTGFAIYDTFANIKAAITQV